jgi:hypothetical protein
MIIEDEEFYWNNFSDMKGPYIVWEYHGYEGWMPRSYDTLEEALADKRFSKKFVVTQLIKDPK